MTMTATITETAPEGLPIAGPDETPRPAFHVGEHVRSLHSPAWQGKIINVGFGATETDVYRYTVAQGTRRRQCFEDEMTAHASAA